MYIFFQDEKERIKGIQEYNDSVIPEILDIAKKSSLPDPKEKGIKRKVLVVGEVEDCGDIPDWVYKMGVSPDEVGFFAYIADARV